MIMHMAEDNLCDGQRRVVDSGALHIITTNSYQRCMYVVSIDIQPVLQLKYILNCSIYIYVSPYCKVMTACINVIILVLVCRM